MYCWYFFARVGVFPFIFIIDQLTYFRHFISVVHFRLNAVTQRSNLKEQISEHYNDVYAMYTKELERIQEVGLIGCILKS